MDLREKIKQLARQYAPDFVKVRRQLHQYPELSFQEIKTCVYIKEQLHLLGITNVVSVAKTGLLATIECGQPGKSILLRADIDALPIIERNDVSYASKNKGVMHACGHDVHTTSLLMCARILYEIKSYLKGTINLLFQPRRSFSWRCEFRHE